MFREARILYQKLFDPERPPAKGEELFAPLLKTTERHFVTEAALMHRHAYPNSEEHLRRHARLLDTLREFAADFAASGATPRKEVCAFIKDRVMMHVLTDDRRLGTFLKGQAAR